MIVIEQNVQITNLDNLKVMRTSHGGSVGYKPD